MTRKTWAFLFAHAAMLVGVAAIATNTPRLFLIVGYFTLSSLINAILYVRDGSEKTL